MDAPDSLITEFTTKKGRKVYDGGGVAPDVKIEADKLSSLAIELVTRFKVFDFATKYSNENESIPQPEDFEITDDIYRQFTEFVDASDFKYESRSQDDFETLMKTAKREKYFGIAEAEFEALKAKLEPNIKKDMKEFREEISELLEDEIVSRYYYQKGAIRASINDDKGIKKAIEELNSDTAYSSYFKSGKVIASIYPVRMKGPLYKVESVFTNQPMET